jgi:hypothetical protein
MKDVKLVIRLMFVFPANQDLSFLMDNVLTNAQLDSSNKELNVLNVVLNSAMPAIFKEIRQSAQIVIVLINYLMEFASQVVQKDTMLI